ncbi:uncharacterized protein [Pyxicephalus adspersus]|uniref:uncharacterized protein n=1 Tax=Pyxicephalus adspersus TaxID=30357 RepID=UPI003B5A574F
MESKELKRNIESFSLDGGCKGNQGYKRVLLQLFGYMGHGKSTFINSCKYILSNGGAFIEFAKAAGYEIDNGSFTLVRKDYELTSNITMVDNRGLRAITDFERVEIYGQLGNFYPLNERVEWNKNFDEVMSIIEESEMDQNCTDFLVPIFIHSSKFILTEPEGKAVKEFLTNCFKMTGIFPIIVITHKRSGNYAECENTFRLMGAEVVISIENYTKENHQQTLENTTNILKVIDSALKNVKFCLDQPRNPKKERKERKTFLYNDIHQAIANHQKAEQVEEQSARKRYCIFL